MIALVAAALLTVASLGIHHRQWRRGAASHFVLVSTPAALLFLILPVPFLAFATIREFGRIGAAGGSGTRLAVGLSFETLRVLGVGSLACAVTMAMAGALQWHAAAREDLPPPDGREKPRHDAVWAPWLLGACALIALPAALLVKVATDVPRLTIRALEMTSAPAAPDPAVLSAFSRDISARLIAATVGGGGLALVGLGAVAAALVAGGRIEQPRRPSRVTWAVGGAIGLAAIVNAVGLQRDLQWVGRVSAAALANDASRPHVESARPAIEGPFSAPADDHSPLRFDGVYRTARRPDGRYRYWFFEPGGRCWLYDTPAEAASPPAPPADGSYWAWQAEGGTLTLLYSEHDSIVRTERGSMASREAITIEGAGYAFIERSRLRIP